LVDRGEFQAFLNFTVDGWIKKAPDQGLVGIKQRSG